MNLQDLNGRVMPSATDIEELILGAVLMDSHCFAEVAAILTPECFYTPEYVKVWKAFEQLAIADKPIDIATVTTQLKANGTLTSVGGAYAVSKLTDRIGSTANVLQHAQIVLNRAVCREQISFGAEIYNLAYDPTNDAMDINDQIAKGSERLSTRLATTKSGTTADQLRQVTERAERAALNQGVTGLETGISDLDKLHGGRQKGHLIIMAGRPAMGKSALALSEALHIAKGGKKVLFLSLEMGAVELMQRALSLTTGVYLDRFRTGEINPLQWELINKATTEIIKTGIRVLDDVVSLSAIRAEARRMKETGGLDIIYIDYLQLIQHTLGGRSRENEVSEVSRSLKLMARSLDVPVVALSQLSRAVESRADKRPMLSDLRESGGIEQDADIVEFIWRPEYYKITDLEGYNDTRGLAFNIVSKNRHGGLMDVPMKFEGGLTKFTDWEGMQVEFSEPKSLPFSKLTPSNAFEQNPF
jgi:replicative DNA helicase